MRAGRGHSHHPLCAFVSSLFTLHISFALKLPATSLSLFWFWFFFLIIVFLNPSSHSGHYNQGLRGEYVFVFVWPCSSFLLH